MNSAKVTNRSCSRPLQRVVTDFGADVAFAQVMDKLVEHYGVLLPASTIRHVTEFHAQRIFETTQVEESWPVESGCETVVAEMDGGMVPVVGVNDTQQDRRKGKTLYWKEAKLCLAHVAGSKTLAYGGTLQGDVNEAGRQLFGCARSVGFGKNSHVHALGDGADWIALQVEAKFGKQGSYLVDLYHVCDYLSDAAAAIHPDADSANAWVNQQKERLKTGRKEEVIAALQPHIEPETVEDSAAVVRSCHRYLTRRKDQLDYAGALARKLPIGSGEIESAHRYIVQKRLKLSGAWWRPENADYMLALRLNRANKKWGKYWEQVRNAA